MVPVNPCHPFLLMVLEDLKLIQEVLWGQLVLTHQMVLVALAGLKVLMVLAVLMDQEDQYRQMAR